MIRRSLLIALLLAAAYALFLVLVKVDWDTTQHLANGNRIKAERFVYGPADSSRTVIVGSSLAYRIELDSFPTGTTNLGFGGLSIYDGLDLVLHAGKRPERVLIETNVLFREADHVFTDAVFAPALYGMRQHMPLMREQYQPSGVLYGWLRKRFTPAVAEAVDTTTVPVQAMIDEHTHNYAQLPADSVQQRFLHTLQADVAALEKQGIEVIFFEVPIHDDLMGSKLSERSRAVIAEKFPQHRFIRTQPGEHWRTTDGLHLDKLDALRYSGQLRRAALGR